MDKIKDEVRLIIAIALALIIIVVFGRPRVQQEEVPQQIPPAVPDREVPVEKDIFLPQPIEKVGEYKVYEDNRYIIKYNTAGGVIEHIGLKEHIRDNETALNIFDGSDLLLTYSLEKPEEARDIYSSFVKGNTLYFQHTRDNITTEKAIKIPLELHTFTATITISNRGKNTAHLKNYIISTGILNIDKRELLPSEIILKSNGEVVRINIARVQKRTIYENTEWIALKQRYGLVFVKPASPLKGFVTPTAENSVKTGFLYDNLEILPDEKKVITFSMYAGPSDYFVAKNEIKEQAVFRTGFFVAMGRFLFTILSYIYRVVPNWGWAIIILTLIVKVIFFPLTQKSLRSMQAMQKLRPYLQEMQKKYKNNPQQMQKELMNLYREYKINPFGGCLPMLIQAPIFVGFFIALRDSIFLRGTPFILWIRDLSTPDTIVQIAGLPLNLLPLIMAVTSFCQQKLTPQDPSQKALLYIMPVMFLVLFYNFSSGLLLYWTTMNIAGLIEQYYILKMRQSPKVKTKIKNKNLSKF